MQATFFGTMLGVLFVGLFVLLTVRMLVSPHEALVNQSVTIAWRNRRNLTAVLQVFIESGQLTAFAFDRSIPWARLRVLIAVFLALNLDLEFPNYVYLFVFAAICGAVLVFLTSVLFLRGSVPGQRLKPLFDWLHALPPGPRVINLMRTAAMAFATTTFLPIMKILSSMLTCRYNEGLPAFVARYPDMQCWTGVHLWGLAPLAVGLIMVYYPTVVMSQWWVQELSLANGDLDVRYTRDFLFLYTQLKFMLAALTTYFDARLFLIVSSIINVFLVSFYAFSRPCSIDSINSIRSLTALAAVWAHVCAFWTIIINDPLVLAPGIVLIVGWIAILFFAVPIVIALDVRTKAAGKEHRARFIRGRAIIQKAFTGVEYREGDVPAHLLAEEKPRKIVRDARAKDLERKKSVSQLKMARREGGRTVSGQFVRTVVNQSSSSGRERSGSFTVSPVMSPKVLRGGEGTVRSGASGATRSSEGTTTSSSVRLGMRRGSSPLRPSSPAKSPSGGGMTVVKSMTLDEFDEGENVVEMEKVRGRPSAEELLSKNS